MSRWLSSVNNLLDSLDNNVGNVVEGDMEDEEDYQGDVEFNMHSVGGQSSVDDILAKRGLLDAVEDEVKDIDAHTMQDDGELSQKSTSAHSVSEEDGHDDDAPAKDETIVDTNDIQILEQSGNEDSTVEGKSEVDSTTHGVDEAVSGSQDHQVSPSDDNLTPVESKSSTEEPSQDVQSTSEKDISSILETKDMERSDNAGSVGDEHINLPMDLDETIVRKEIMTEVQDRYEIEIKELQAALEEQKGLACQAAESANAASREIRKLRRNVVKLNAELESAERELDAQRTELERAAVRMEKDRQRAKEDKDHMERSHLGELESIMAEHKASTEALVTGHASQLRDMEDRVKRADEARAKEGGDMTLELSEAAEREREALKKALRLEEQNATLESQVSSLTNQMTTVQARLESVQQILETSYAREREVDDKLDAALSQHARQLSIRKAREAELERNVADLGAALVISRQKEVYGSKTAEKIVDDDSDSEKLKEKLESTQAEVEALASQVMIERQRSDTLQRELEDISDERAKEVSALSEKQRQNDDRVADLMAHISSLESSLRVGHGEGRSIDKPKEQQLQSEISSLSEELLKTRKKLQNTSTEVLTLRNRLRAALDRADAAEKMYSMITPTKMGRNDIEKGNVSNRLKRRMVGKVSTPSIRAAVRLEGGRRDSREQIGTIIDMADNVTIEIGSYLRKDPIARLCFLVYMVFIHLWIVCIFIFHAHGSLEPPVSVGPSQLLTHSYRHMEQVHDLKSEGS